MGIVPRSNLHANLRQGYGDGKSFRSQDGTVGQARTTCGVDPFSNRPVYHGSVVRPYGAMDEATRHCGRSLLQPVSGGDFNGPGSGNRDTRVAVPTRGPET